jgi:cytochrome c oxidase cbb3-type subunit I/II
MYWVRVTGGSLYIIGAILFAYNIFRTWRARPAAYAVPVIQAAPLPKKFVAPPTPAPVPAGAWARFASLGWHRRWEALPITFTVLTTVAVVIASLFEIIPTFLIKSNVPTIASVTPFTPLELAGRDLYIREGCFNCHSQMVRPFRYETSATATTPSRVNPCTSTRSCGGPGASARTWHARAASIPTCGTSGISRIHGPFHRSPSCRRMGT